MTHPVVALGVVVIEIGVTRPRAVANLSLGLLADWKSHQRKMLSQHGENAPKRRGPWPRHSMIWKLGG